MFSPTPPAGEMPLDRKAIFGWAMFDFANSSFTTVMVTAQFSIYFMNSIVPADPDSVSKLHPLGTHLRGADLWGQANAISQLLVILTAPLFGALADFSGAKKKFLFMTYFGCSILTMALGWIGPGQVLAAMILFMAANFFYSSGENFIGAFLPEIAPQRLMGLISGLAWGLGYVGGIGSLLVAAAITKYLGDEQGSPWIWIMIGIWFLIAGLPTFLWVKERHQHEKMPAGENIYTVGFYRLGKTLREARHFRQLFRFLFVFMIISVGLTAVVGYAGKIAVDTLHLNMGQLAIFLILPNVMGIVGAVGWGQLQDKIGSNLAIVLSLFTWLGALGLVFMIPPISDSATPPHSALVLFWSAGALVGIGMGATSSSCRALIGLFSPEEKSGEFFGLWGLFGKLGGLLGPLVFGKVTYLSGDIRVAELTIGVFFALGAVLMFWINEKEGREATHQQITK